MASRTGDSHSPLQLRCNNHNCNRRKDISHRWTIFTSQHTYSPTAAAATASSRQKHFPEHYSTSADSDDCFSNTASRDKRDNRTGNIECECEQYQMDRFSSSSSLSTPLSSSLSSSSSVPSATVLPCSSPLSSQPLCSNNSTKHKLAHHCRQRRRCIQSNNASTRQLNLLSNSVFNSNLCSLSRSPFHNSSHQSLSILVLLNKFSQLLPFVDQSTDSSEQNLTTGLPLMAPKMASSIRLKDREIFSNRSRWRLSPSNLSSSSKSSASSSSFSSSSSSSQKCSVLLKFVLFICFLLYIPFLSLPVISAQPFTGGSSSLSQQQQLQQHRQSDYLSGRSAAPSAKSDLYFEYYPPHRPEDSPAPNPSSSPYDPSSSSSSAYSPFPSQTTPSNRRGKARQFGKAPSFGFDDNDLVNNVPETYPSLARTLDPQRFFGGQITGQQVMGRGDSQAGNHDYVIRTDIFVPRNARLVIKPGVKIAFASGVGITVQGTLIANGTEKEQIFLTSNTQNSNWATSLPPTTLPPRPILPTIRLVDSSAGNYEGRLQLNYKGRWHSVCTASRNWTQFDVEVVCRQLGFSSGQWYRWFARHNDSRQFLYENPACSGKEMGIQDCSNWNRRQIGSGVCNFHHDIGIRCSLHASQPDPKFWRGITFQNAESRISSILSDKMEISMSRSVLDNVVIENAGRTADGVFVSGLLVDGGVPPYMANMVVKNSASTGLNITDPSNGFFLYNSKFLANGAYGVHINSSVGRILMSNVDVQNNGADGIHFIHHDKQIFSQDTFCQTPNLGQSQTFPIRYTHRQTATRAPTEECCQDFYAHDWKGQRITVHFPVLASGIESPDTYRTMGKLVVPEKTAQTGRDGSIYVVDGHAGKVIADFVVRNGTRVQSVSSILANGPLKVCYRPAQYRNVLFTIEAVVDYGREFDLAVVDGKISNNNGRGVWIENLRSGLIVNRTELTGHDHVAAIHVAGGVGEVVVNNSRITNNVVDGLNVTTGGGYFHVDRTEILKNTHRAIGVWFNESLALRSFNYSSSVTRSIIRSNRIGLQVDVGCRFHTPMKQAIFWNISMNSFDDQSEQAIHFGSCVPRPRLLKMATLPVLANVSISHNYFTANQLQAVHIAPIFFVKLNLMHNEFVRHPKAVLYINNRDTFDVESFVEEAERFPFSLASQSADSRELTSKRHYALDNWPVVVRIRNNNFHHNRGHYVASIGLFEPETSKPQNVSSLPQKILFTRNILTDNTVSEPFPALNSRSKTAAVLCVTSSNVLIWRNEFVNRDSKYELAVHLPAHYRMINASLNYWGTWRSNGYQSMQQPISQFAPSFKSDDMGLHSAAAIYERIFDHKNRYNLAHVEIFPYIMVPHALESNREALSAHIDDRDKISQFFTSHSSGEIGGQVRGQVNLAPGKYLVKRDIYVTPEGELVLNPGTELYFEQSVGVFVQGKFKAKGYKEGLDIKFLLSTGNVNEIRRPRRDTEIVLLDGDSDKPRNLSNLMFERSKKADLTTVVLTTEKPKAANMTVQSLAKQTSSSSPSSSSSQRRGQSIAASPIKEAVSVRLSNNTEGRLEVRVGSEWGTVCGYNFDIEDAAVACHQLGLVLNPRDWRLEKSHFWNAVSPRSILLSNIACTHLDTDLAQCKAERLINGDFELEAWCPMGEVGIRCYPTAWAGLRFGMLTQEAILETVTVERAGLFDYRTRKFVPAVQFDFNRFTVQNSIIRSNIDSGLGLLWNDVLSEPYIEGLRVLNTVIASNLNHGIVTKSQGVLIKDCDISHNREAGISYEPTFSLDEQEELTSWVVRRTFSSQNYGQSHQQSHFGRRPQIYTIPHNGPDYNDFYNQEIKFEDVGKQTFVYIPRRPTPSSKSHKILIQTTPGQRIGVMAISPIFLTRSTESLKLYAPQFQDAAFVPKMIWDMRQNLTAFPFVYSGYRLVLEYSTGQLPYGGVLLLFTNKQVPKEVIFQQIGIAEMTELEQRNMNTMRIISNDISDNGKGIVASHCSMNIDFSGTYCKRYGNETIYMEKNKIAKSKGAGVFVNSYAHSSTIPYSLLLEMLGPEGIAQSELARLDQQKHWRAPEFTLTGTIVGEINYTMIENKLTDNGDFGSIVLYDHSLYENGDLQRSSLQLGSGLLMSNAVGANLPANTNLFHWRVLNCTLQNNRNGGVDIRLPYTWLYNENFTHTVVFQGSEFVDNNNFEFAIGGHYAKVSLTGNKFWKNTCKRGVVSVSGMEKAMLINKNEMLENSVQEYVLELNVASHADKFGTVKAFVEKNVIKHNRNITPMLRDATFGAYSSSSSTATSNGYSPETYAIAIRGVQQVNVTRNILVNRNLQFELLAGVRSGSLQNELDARENWWGVSADPAAIRERIFDFDDWNSFATAHFSPWLTDENINAQVYYDSSSSSERQNNPSSYYLGGRLSHSMTLEARSRPYIVNADLTIMPGATLSLRPGVVMEFYPSVGILVLGDLVSIGNKENPVTLRPLTKRRNTTASTRGRSNSAEESFVYRLSPASDNRKRRQPLPTTEQLVFSKSDIGGVRLCLTENCDPTAEQEADNKMIKRMQVIGDDSYPGSGRNRSKTKHGYLEIYNTTTLQWAPVCDTRFTLRNAQVVCRQLGKSPLNAFVRRGPRHDMDPTLMSRIAHWPDALECVGGERSLADCEQRTYSSDGSDSGRSAAASYQSQPFVRSAESIVRARTPYGMLYDNATLETLFYWHDDWTILNERATMQSTVCRYDGADFVYVFCGQDITDESDNPIEHWGGVRFALPAYEERGRSRTGAATFADPAERSVRRVATSRMQYTNILGAGVLHGEKSAAVQMVQRAVPLEFVNVKSSAATGVEAIAPPESLNLAQMEIENNLGPGLNMLVLGASSSESSRVPYQPLTNGPDTSLPYNAFSLVDICDAKKELRIDEKVIVYYKYDNRPVDCVKIFTSSNPLKRIGVRFLQANLWSAFARPEGRTENGGGTGDDRDDDYLQGRKFLYESEDMFHNRISSLGDNDGTTKSSGRIMDDSLLNSMSDSVLLWDGDVFNETTRRLLGEVYSDSVKDVFASSDIVAQEAANLNGVPYSRGSRKRNVMFGTSGVAGQDPKTRLFRSASNSLSLQLHASGASGRYGFIAEITTLPGAYYADRATDGIVQHNITHSRIRDNAGGAILYRSVGESIAPLSLANNVFERNCVQAWGNFSSCESFSLDLTIQNAIYLQFQNNLVNENRAGGLKIRATSYTAVGALKAQLSNNLFSANLHREAFYFEGAQVGHSYQTLDAKRNYFTRNRSPHRSNIVFGRAVVKFEENVVVNNVADSQLFIVGFAHAQSSSALQHCSRNFFYNNRAVNERAEQSTIIAATVGQVYSDNYLVNPDNNFELATRNRTIITTGTRGGPLDFGLRQSLLQPTAIASVLASAVVRAPNNWWGFNETSAVEARIRDAADYHNLIPVNFAPFHSANWTVLSGSCFGGYKKIGDTCFVYVGGRMDFHSARRFCERDNSSMPFVRAGNREELTRYVYMQQPAFDRRRHPVWVQSFDVPIGTCSVLVDGVVQEHRCNDELPLLCERDPEIGVSGATTLDFWYQEPLGIAAIGISLLTLLMSAGCVCCWICKSRHRHLEKLERRNSIRASIRSSRSFMSMNTLNSDGNYFAGGANRKLLHSNVPTVQGSMGNVSGASLGAGSIYRASGRQTANINHNPNGQPTNTRPKNGFFNSAQSISSASSIFDSPLEAVGRRSMRQPSNQNPSTSGYQSSSRHHQRHHQDSDLNMLMRPTPTFDLMYENQGFKGQSTPLSPASFASSRDTRTLPGGEPGQRAWTPDTNSTLDFKVPGAPSIDARELSQYTASTDNIHKSIPSSASSDSSQSTAPSILSQHSQQQVANIRPSKSKQSIFRNPVQPPLPPPPIPAIPGREMHRKSLDSTYFSSQPEPQEPAPIYADNQSIASELTDRSEMMTFNPRKGPVSSFAAAPPIARRLNESAAGQRPLGGSQPALSQGPGPYRGPQGSAMDSQYLETSLDAESFYNESFHHGDERFSPTHETDPSKARLYASQPLETAM